MRILKVSLDNKCDFFILEIEYPEDYDFNKKKINVKIGIQLFCSIKYITVPFRNLHN